MHVDKYSLENGLTVILIDTKLFPTLTTLLLVGAGSRYETEDNNGVAHFFEHMAFKGSKKYPNAQTIASKIEGLGGIFNAFTSKDHTGYWIKARSSHFERVLDVLSDMILNSNLSPEEIEREKGVITEEINMYEDTPQRKVEEVLDSMMYKDHPLGYDIIGSKETVMSFKRDTFESYIKSLYHPNNSVLVVCGGFGDNNKYKNIIEQKLGNWRKKDVVKMRTFEENQKRPGIVVRNKKTEQAHFCLAYRAFSFFDERKYALGIITTILGGGMSSRLFREVRERRGLCYYVYSSRDMYHDCGSVIIQAGVVNKEGKIKEAVKVTQEQIEDMLDGNISDEELCRAKEMIKGRVLLSLENSNSIASFYGGKQILEGVLAAPEDVLKKLDAITLDQCKAITKEVFAREKSNFALIGPFKREHFDDLI